VDHYYRVTRIEHPHNLRPALKIDATQGNDEKLAITVHIVQIVYYVDIPRGNQCRFANHISGEIDIALHQGEVREAEGVLLLVGVKGLVAVVNILTG